MQLLWSAILKMRVVRVEVEVEKKVIGCACN